MRISRLVVVLWVLAAFAGMVQVRVAVAAEGMYLLDRLPQDRLKRCGLKIPVARLGELSRAVVHVGRGGTGSFVSPRGLLVTNHHVAFRCLVQLNARAEHQGIMDRGHVARTLADELPCPGLSLQVVVGVREVTREMKEGIPAPTRRNYAGRFEALRRRKEKLRRTCEQNGRLVCEVAEMDGGTAYYLSTYRRIRDVRLVYAPPRALGKFGGDIDNWMYPRHTADFTFLRAYVDAEGREKSHDRANVPLSTPVHLSLSPGGVSRGSLVMVIGFPGRTARHVTSHSARFHLEQNLRGVLSLLDRLLVVLHGRMAASPDTRRKYEGMEWGLQNAVKYYRMSKEGFERWQVPDRKLEQERALLGTGERPGTLPAAEAREGQALLAEIGQVIQRQAAFFPRFRALSWMTRTVASLRAAFDIARWAVEKGKPDEARKEDRYKDKNIFELTEAAERLDREIGLETERELLLFFLREADRLPRGQRLASVRRLKQSTRRALARLGQQARRLKVPLPEHLRRTLGVPLTDDLLKSAVDLLYGQTALLARSNDAAEVDRAMAWRRKLLGLSDRELSRVDDPLVRFARDLAAEEQALREGPYKEVEQYLGSALHPRWVQRFRRPAYPDANGTVRLSFGSVQDYTTVATGRTHLYLTGLAGLMKKDRKEFPFLVPAWLARGFPQRLRSRWVDRRIKDIPVNFTSTLDTTGGNSGSPVLDDRGRLVGLLFDGTPESILSDWQYLQKEQRSISVDIRLALYLAGLQGAVGLLQELGLKRP